MDIIESKTERMIKSIEAVYPDSYGMAEWRDLAPGVLSEDDLEFFLEVTKPGYVVQFGLEGHPETCQTQYLQTQYLHTLERAKEVMNDLVHVSNVSGIKTTFIRIVEAW